MVKLLNCYLIPKTSNDTLSKGAIFLASPVCIFGLVLRCLLVARKENLTVFSTGLTGPSKNLDPTGQSTRPLLISGCNASRM